MDTTHVEVLVRDSIGTQLLGLPARDQVDAALARRFKPVGPRMLPSKGYAELRHVRAGIGS